MRRWRRLAAGERMGQGQGSAQEQAALREALLRYLDLNGRPLASRRELQLQVWLHRRHLSWLLLPWYLARAAWSLLLPGQRQAAAASEDRAIDLYRQASGMDRQGAWDEVWRLAGQLAPLVDRPEFVGLEQTAEPPGANPAELEAAAEVLLGCSLAGRRTDDQLLGAVLALWDEHEDWMVHGYERLVQQGITGRRAQDEASLAEAQAWRQRYRLAWRHWFDRQAEQGSATSPRSR
jgi:hypothetical protein